MVGADTHTQPRRGRGWPLGRRLSATGFLPCGTISDIVNRRFCCGQLLLHKSQPDAERVDMISETGL